MQSIEVQSEILNTHQLETFAYRIQSSYILSCKAVNRFASAASLPLFSKEKEQINIQRG